MVCANRMEFTENFVEQIFYKGKIEYVCLYTLCIHMGKLKVKVAPYKLIAQIQ